MGLAKRPCATAGWLRGTRSVSRRHLAGTRSSPSLSAARGGRHHDPPFLVVGVRNDTKESVAVARALSASGLGFTTWSRS